MSRKIERRFSKRYLHTYIHCNIIHNSQKVEAALMPTDKWEDKENVLHAYVLCVFSRSAMSDSLWPHGL